MSKGHWPTSTHFPPSPCPRPLHAPLTRGSRPRCPGGLASTGTSCDTRRHPVPSPRSTMALPGPHPPRPRPSQVERAPHPRPPLRSDRPLSCEHKSPDPPCLCGRALTEQRRGRTRPGPAARGRGAQMEQQRVPTAPANSECPRRYNGLGRLHDKAPGGVEGPDRACTWLPEGGRPGMYYNGRTPKQEGGGGDPPPPPKGCIGRGGGGFSGAPSLCPATVPRTASARLNGICNRQ